MQTSKQPSSNEFVYLLHAAVQRPMPKSEPGPDVQDDENKDDADEDGDDDGGLKEINFDD
jgi:hypothetical protein